MCSCNLNARFIPIFVNITLIFHLLMFCRIRRKIKQSDGKNQVKRKLLVCSNLLVAVHHYEGVLRHNETQVEKYNILEFVAAKEYDRRDEAVSHYEGKASPQQSPSKQR